MIQGVIDSIIKLKEKCTIENELIRDLGITVVEMKALILFEGNNRLTCREFANSIGLSLSRSSRIIDRLTAKGLLNREADKTDRRCITITLTPEGKTSLEKIEKAKEACEQRLLKNLDNEEVKKVKEGLKVLLKII